LGEQKSEEFGQLCVVGYESGVGDGEAACWEEFGALCLSGLRFWFAAMRQIIHGTADGVFAMLDVDSFDERGVQTTEVDVVTRERRAYFNRSQLERKHRRGVHRGSGSAGTPSCLYGAVEVDDVLA
jgi:hypothetical protein